MSKSPRGWAKEELKFYLECLASSSSVKDAHRKYCEKYPGRGDREVRKKFKRENLNAPASYLMTSGFDLQAYSEEMRDANRQALIDASEKKELAEFKKKKTVVDMIIDEVKAEVYRLPKPREIKAPAVHIKRDGREDLVAVVSDVQIGELVLPEMVAGAGEYSIEIFEKRVEKWKSYLIKVVKERREKFNVEKLHIPFIGDIVEGMEIFASQPFHLDVGLVKQAVRGSQIFAEAVAEVAASCGDLPIEIEHVGGNHGRIGRKGQTPYTDNWDRVVGFMMEMMLEKYDTVKVLVPEAWFILKEIQGWTFHFSHGDDINSWMSIPAYGMMRAHARETIMLGRAIHYYQIGHHHVLSQIQNGHGEVLCNGNWVGANEFSAKQIKMASRPCQIMYSVTPEHGIGDRFVCYFESKKEFLGRQEKFLNSVSMRPSAIPRKVEKDRSR